MGNAYRSDHPTDADLLEALLAREADPHLTHCARCTQRAETIASGIDPLRDEPRGEPFDELFYRRQASRIRARIAAGEGRRPSLSRFLVPSLPRLAWAAGAVAAVVALAVALHGRAPVGRGPVDEAVTASRGFQSPKDLADDQLLRDVDHTLDDDPYDFGPV
jgi:hypothetical protein